MRNRAPQYDLRGDTRKAKTWIPWAQQQIKRLRNLNADNPVNKVLRPVIGVGIWLRSVGDYDYIRIVVSKLVDKCKLTATLTALGGSEVNFNYLYEFDDNSSNQAVYVDTGGKFLSGNNRYFTSTFDSEGIVDTDKLFLSPGDYTITSFAQANDVIVSHSTGVIDVPTYQVIMDVSSIAPKASLLITIASLGNDPVECYANGDLIGTVFDATHRTTIITIAVDVVDTMTMDFVALGNNIRTVAVIFRQYDCLSTDTQTITVT